LGETVLGHTYSVLDLEATTSSLALFSEIIVHTFYSKLKECCVFLLVFVSRINRGIEDKHWTKSLESQDLCCLLHFWVLCANLRTTWY